MDRRAFIGTLTGSFFALPLAAAAQTAQNVSVVGLLFAFPPAAARIQDDAFRQGLGDLGYVEGQNITIYRRYLEGNRDHLARLAIELVRLNVDVIVAPASTAALAAKQATSAIPVVFALANDPVGVGLVVSLARPGSNVTGLTPVSADLNAKRLEVLKEFIPGISRIALLSSSTYPIQARQAMIRDMEAAARLLRLDLHVLEVGRPNDLDGAFSAMQQERVAAVTVLPLPFFFGERRRIAGLALKHRLPSIFHWKEYVEVGGLMSYGASQTDLMRRAAGYVDKILKGAKPGDLPIEQPTQFELVINLKTAKALGLTIPPSLLQRADQVIE